MAGNNSIQILRGTASNIASSTETLLDGQLMYDKTNNQLYIGNGNQAVNSATLINGDKQYTYYCLYASGSTTQQRVVSFFITLPNKTEVNVNTVYSLLQSLDATYELRMYPASGVMYDSSVGGVCPVVGIYVRDGSELVVRYTTTGGNASSYTISSIEAYEMF